MAADDAAVTVSLRAELKGYESALKAAVRATERAAKAAEDALGAVGKKKSFGGLNDNFKKSAGQLSNDARVLQYQLNDIFSGIASGQGIRAVQMQLGQIAQQLGGQGLRSAARTMGSAMLSMISPINIAVVAFGALATVAASYFTDSEKDAKDFTKALDEQLKAVNKLREAQGLKPVERGGGNDPIALFAAQREAMTKNEETAAALVEKLNEVSDAILSVPKDAFEGQTATIQDLDGALRQLQEGIKDGTADFYEFAKTLEEIEKRGNLPADIRKLVREVIDLAAQGALSAQNLQDLRDAMDGVAKAEQRASESLKRFNDNLSEMGKIAAGQVSDTQRLLDLYMQVIGQARTMGQVLAANAAFEQGTQRIETERITGTPSAAKEFLKTRAASDAIAASLDRLDDEMATALAKLFQTLPATARITSGVRTYEEQARLRARYEAGTGGLAAPAGRSRHERGAAVDIGQGVSMEELREAVKLVPELEQLKGRAYEVDKVHVQLAGERQRIEKETAEQTVKNELERAEAAERATKNIADYLARLDEQATLEQRIAEIKTSKLSAEDQARAIAVETELQTALNLAKQNEVTLTAQQIAQIRAATLAKTDAKIASDAYAQSQKDSADAMKQFNQQVSSIAQSAISGLVNDLRNGVDAGEAFNNMLNRIIDSLIQMSLQAIFNPAGGGGGILGKLFGVAHTGGVVGQTAFPQRKVSPMVFANAPRFASGGVVGLRPGEVPIIAHRGEIIVPNARRLAGNAAGGSVDNSIHQQNKISIDMAGSGYVAANSDSAKAVGENIQKLVQAELVRESRPGGLLRKVPR